MTDANDLNNRKQKAIDIASTYMQVLITLSSGILAAIIGFYPTLLTLEGFSFQFLTFSLAAFVISIFFGLVGLGALVIATNNVAVSSPTSKKLVRFPTCVQLGSFFVGICLLFFTLPK